MIKVFSLFVLLQDEKKKDSIELNGNDDANDGSLNTSEDKPSIPIYPNGKKIDQKMSATEVKRHSIDIFLLQSLMDTCIQLTLMVIIIISITIMELQIHVHRR
jgi:hypothetical protein